MDDRNKSRLSFLPSKVRTGLVALGTALLLFGVISCQDAATQSTPTNIAASPTSIIESLPGSADLPGSTAATAQVKATATAEPTEEPATPTPTATATATPTPASVNQSTPNLWQTTAFDNGEMNGLQAEAQGLRLSSAPAPAQTEGQYISPVETTAAPFNNAVLSWAADMPANTGLRLDLRVKVGDNWSTWYTMGAWTNGRGASKSGQADNYGRVSIDTLQLNQPAQAMQYRVTMSSAQAEATPTLRSVSVAYKSSGQPIDTAGLTLLPDWARDLPVPQISQAVQDPAIRWQICSPTSLTMVLNYWGEDKALLDVVRGVKDGTTGIYGNWPLNTAYAATLGFDAHIARFGSVEQLQNEIAQGRPVVVSIEYGPGAISAAPLNSTSGHLIVVRGFTPDGDVIVNDPAAPSHDSVRRVYDRAQFSNVWLSSGGIAYILAPQAT